jgi:hypothetical protein
MSEKLGKGDKAWQHLGRPKDHVSLGSTLIRESRPWNDLEASVGVERQQSTGRGHNRVVDKY